MRNLLWRAQRVYRNKGAVTTIRTAIRFLIRDLRHTLGTKRLYGNSYFRNLLIWSNSRPYSAVADPFKIVHVDPEAITHVTERGPNPGQFQWQDIGTVRGGDWDRGDQRVEDLPVVQALRERFGHGADWEEIEFIQYVIEQSGHDIITSTDEFR